MTKIVKYATISLLILLTSAMLMLSMSAYAQEEIPPDQYPQVPNPYNPPSPPPTAETAIVVIAASVGGTTNPGPGSYSYDFGETIIIQATANSGYKFLYWIISGTYTVGHNVPPINYPENAASDPEWVPDFPSPSSIAEDSLVVSTNPLTVICGYGYTYVYQPVFAPTTAPTPPSTGDAVVVILQSLGGTTNPGPGTYRYLNGSTIRLTATPDSGYEFVYWVASGEDGSHPTTFTDNPTAIICGYGYTYTYQAMFQPAGAGPAATAEIPLYIWAVIIVLVILVIAALAFAMMRGKK